MTQDDFFLDGGSTDNLLEELQFEHKTPVPFYLPRALCHTQLAPAMPNHSLGPHGCVPPGLCSGFFFSLEFAFLFLHVFPFLPAYFTMSDLI